jgi:hypothetical protein
MYFLDEEPIVDGLPVLQHIVTQLETMAGERGGMTTHPDADLLRLGRRFDEALARERATAATPAGLTDEALESFTEQAIVFADQIENLRATTIEGMRVKARVIAWCGGFPDQPDDREYRVAASIVRDLTA